MGPRFVNMDRDTPLLLPLNLRDWLPTDHLVHFILDAVDPMDLRAAKVNGRGTGSEQYPPSMLSSLLFYCYATGIFSSRQIERASFENVAVRVICADTHPDHDTICTFRRENQPLINESFVKVLPWAQALKLLRVGQLTTAVEGTKILANASKHAAVSYGRAGKQIEQIELEVQQLLEKAEQADSPPLQEGLNIPDEIVRRQERQARLAQARAVIEARAKARAAADLIEYQKKLAKRAAQKERGEPVRSPEPQAPSEQLTPGGLYYAYCGRRFTVRARPRCWAGARRSLRGTSRRRGRSAATTQCRGPAIPASLCMRKPPG